MNASREPLIPTVSEEVAAAMEWWREAGVDCDFADDATSWLASQDPLPSVDPGQSEPQPPPSEVPEQRPGSPAQPKAEIERVDFFAQGAPQSLEEFREFWLTAPGLDAIGPRGRVPPRGASQPLLMVLVVDPEDRDRETLLSGPQGRLLDRILAATATAHGSVYFASALPRHTPLADTAALAMGGLDKVVEHHIALAAPQRILAFGAQLTPFIAENPADTQTSLRSINYKSALPPTLACEGLDALLETPPLKARFWRRWMEWSADK